MWGTVVDHSAARRGSPSLYETRNRHHNEATYREGVEDGNTTSDTEIDRSGTWGEADNQLFDQADAIREYEALGRSLSALRHTRTQESQASRRRREGRRASSVFSKLSKQKTGASAPDADPEAAAAAEAADDDDNAVRLPEGGGEDFDLEEFLRERRNGEKREEKRVGVVWENLTVRGVDSAAKFVRTVPDAVLGTFGPDLYRILCSYFPALMWRKPPTRPLLHDFSGCVRHGEMLLVLGRPGSGCSTFLRAITNKRGEYASVEGDVSYGGISASVQSKHYRGEVVYNGEDDIHFPLLDVWKTITFALTNKSKKANKSDINVIGEAFLKIFGISHTKHTRVGDDFVRGVSGGERKRVSIAETLAAGATVTAWDNSTRGLDASTALDYTRSLRTLTDINKKTTLVTLYQVSEGIYKLFDKVLVIDSGREVYYGPAAKAKEYFVNLGFECPERQTTADFLTAVTDPVERRARPGFEDRVPRTPEEMQAAFRASPDYQASIADLSAYKAELEQSQFRDAREFEGTVQATKSKHVSSKSSYTIPFHMQVLACTKRELWLLLADKTMLWTKACVIISNALVIGSLFFDQQESTQGLFSRGGAIFLSILFLAWLQLTELMNAVSGRTIVNRHRDYAFYRPSAVSIARVVLDLPLIAMQCFILIIVMYWMTNLDADVSKFFIFLLIVYTTVVMMTALYRMLASLSPEIDTAVRFSGIGLNILIIHAGYVIPKPQLLNDYIWFGWLFWVNPFSYAFEAGLSNEISNRHVECDPIDTFPPSGPGVDPENQGCALAGSVPGQSWVSGRAYLQEQYDYSRDNLWRNWAVVIAFAVLYILVTVIATETINFASGGGGVLMYKKTRRGKNNVKAATAPTDEEKNASSGATLHGSPTGGSQTSDTKAEENGGDMNQLVRSSSIFTWHNIEYTVPYGNGERKLLNNVSGYAKPGIMIALMGASGAGKTTLLNTLSQRQTVGVVKGDMLVDGKPLGLDFQRNTGFCLQGDLHDTTQTVREAIEFSALLRQEASVPRAEKLAYVDQIIDLLELNDLQDVIISCLGVEQRKRLTIGVELAAKPSLLLFLDEPTSGLDSASAYSIVRFLKKLSHAGQAIVCTIHQPSSVLIEQFDMVLALNPGGNTLYFGPIGKNGEDVVRYFAERGAVCPPEKNVAEFILETAARPHRKPDGTKVNWNKEWVESKEAQKVLSDIEEFKRVRLEESANDNSSTTAQSKTFAAPTYVQCIELTKRMFKQLWRDPSYIYGKIFVSIVVAIFNGFTFWQLGDSIQDMQNRLFTVFLMVTVPPTIVNAVVPKFYQNMSLWMAREHPSRIYNWIAFCTANIVAELPWAILGGVLYWAVWYWATGLPSDSEASGYTFLMTILMYFFMSSWGQWICAFAPSFTVISNVLPTFFVMFGLFNGVVRPWAVMPDIWKYWIYYLNPSTYWIAGIMAVTLKDQQVRCGDGEAAIFNPPSSQTCSEFALEYAEQLGGYLVNPNDTSECQYCPYSDGKQYLQALNLEANDAWRNFGIFLGFCFSNWMLVYFFIWSVRVKGWSFGFGTLTGLFDKAIEKISGLLTRKSKKTEEVKA
jgi:ATP-binding cassette subfamily G (WHITE) protein 2 (SNQ2)